MKNQRAVIYARYSSHNQRDVSIDIQLEAGERYCKEHGLKVVGTYCDHAMTGRNTNRPQFKQMLIDASRHNFDYVVIYKVTRIMRNRDEMALARITLRKSGVEILYAGEDIAQGSSGVLQLGMLEVLAEWESALDSERIIDGIHANAEKCMANGQPLYGWDIVDGYYVVNEQEKKLLTEMKDRFLDGQNLSEIARALKPYKNKRGKPFVRIGIEKMLKRKQNAGIYSYAGVEKEGGMPALWSIEEQKRIWAMFETKTGPAHVNVADYPLTGKLYWGQWPMVGDSGTSATGHRYYYYLCKKNKKRIPKEDVEKAVSDVVIEALASPEKREKIADLVMEYEHDCEDDTKQSDVIRDEIREIDKKFENIWKAIEDGMAPPGGRERIDALTERRELLEDELATALSIEGVKLDRDRVLYWLEKMAQNLEPETIIRIFVARVTVTEDHYKVLMTFDDGSSSDEYSQGPPKEHYPNYYIFAVKRGFVIVVGRSHKEKRS